MSGRPLSGATYSGYDKGEVYNALTKSLIMKKYEDACYFSAELACTRNELPHLLGHLMDIFAKYTNFDNLKTMIRVYELIRDMSALPKKQVSYNNVFQRLLCELVLLISINKRDHALDLVLKENGCNYSIIEHYVYKYNTKSYDFVHATFTDTDEEILKLFDIVYNLIKHQDKKGVIIVLSYIIHNKNLQFQNISYDEIVNIPENTRSDIIWYLWRLLLCIIQHRHRHDEHVVESMNQIFLLFLSNYQKKHRSNRLNMLIYAFALLCDDQFKVKNDEVQYPIIDEAINKIHFVYEDILKPSSSLENIDFEGDLAYLNPINCPEVKHDPPVKVIDKEQWQTEKNISSEPDTKPSGVVSKDKKKHEKRTSKSLDYLNHIAYYE